MQTIDASKLFIVDIQEPSTSVIENDAESDTLNNNGTRDDELYEERNQGHNNINRASMNNDKIIALPNGNNWIF